MLEYVIAALVAAIFALFVCFLSDLALAGVAWFLFVRWQAAARALLTSPDSLLVRVEKIECAIQNAIDEAKSAEMSEKGTMGAEVRRENARLQAQARAEGEAILLAPGTPDGKKAAFLGLIQKYPTVAVKVAEFLDGKYKIASALGMSPEQLVAMVGQFVAKAAAPPENEAPALGSGL